MIHEHKEQGPFDGTEETVEHLGAEHWGKVPHFHDGITECADWHIDEEYSAGNTLADADSIAEYNDRISAGLTMCQDCLWNDGGPDSCVHPNKERPVFRLPESGHERYQDMFNQYIDEAEEDLRDEHPDWIDENGVCKPEHQDDLIGGSGDMAHAKTLRRIWDEGYTIYTHEGEELKDPRKVDPTREVLGAICTCGHPEESHAGLITKVEHGVIHAHAGGGDCLWCEADFCAQRDDYLSASWLKRVMHRLKEPSEASMCDGFELDHWLYKDSEEAKAPWVREFFDEEDWDEEVDDE